MFKPWLLGLRATLLGLILSCASPLLAAERWVALKASTERRDATAMVLKLQPGQGFSRALQLTVKSGPTRIRQLVIEYGNGQRDDLGDVEFVPGQRATVLERGDGDYLAVSSITLVTDQPSTTTWTLEAFGLQSDAPAPTQTLTADELLKILQNKGPTAPGPGPERPEASGEKKFAEVSVHYATTRKRSNDIEKYGRRIATYGAQHSGGLAYGRSIVTIPTTHRRGTIERPLIDWVIWNYNAEDPARHFTVAATDEGRDLFLRGLRLQAGIAKSFKKQAMLFIHGYNTSFEDALFRAAQLGHDIGFDGPVLTFSWAARSGLLNMVRYGADREAALAAEPALGDFLNALAKEAGIDSVHIIAHSMGNAPVLSVLAEHGRRMRAQPTIGDLKIRHVVFAAPDVSEQLFGHYAKDLKGWTKSVTLLASTNDKAMVVSKQYSDQPRAGGVRCVDNSALASPDFYLIDVSQADTSFLGFNHSSFAERQHVITDLRLLLEAGRQPPHERMPVYQRRGAASNPCWWYVKN